MVWQAVETNGERLAKFSHYPVQINKILGIDILVCNQDWWVAKIALTYAMALSWFWSNVVPSPRELERKALLGGYRCGFYFDIKVKSPMHIIFGEGTATVIAEIAAPFAKFLFFWWATAATYEAISDLYTVVYPQLACADEVGIFYQGPGSAPIPQGGVSGAVTFQATLYDPYNLALPFEMGNVHGVGHFRVLAAWFFDSALTGITDVQTGWEIDSNVVEVQHHGDLGAGQQLAIIREYESDFTQDGVIGPWFSAGSGPRLLPATASVVRYVYNGPH